MSNPNTTFCLSAQQRNQLLNRPVGELPSPGFCMMDDNGQEVFTSVNHASSTNYNSVLLQGQNAWHCKADTLFSECIAKPSRVPGISEN